MSLGHNVNSKDLIKAFALIYSKIPSDSLRTEKALIYMYMHKSLIRAFTICIYLIYPQLETTGIM